MLDKDLEQTIYTVLKKARMSRYSSVTLEQLLLELLNNKSALDMLLTLGANIDRLRNNLSKDIEQNINMGIISLVIGDHNPSSHLTFKT